MGQHHDADSLSRVVAWCIGIRVPSVYTNKYGSASIDWKDPYAARCVAPPPPSAGWHEVLPPTFVVAGWLKWGREVTYALLKHDFDLELDIPIDQLCPPVPNRANYIYWLRDLLHRNSPQLCTGPDTRVRGLDMCASLLLPHHHHWPTACSQPASVCCAPIAPAPTDRVVVGGDLGRWANLRGTGASCIYPLLGAKIHGWSFVATDIDETSLRHARHNVALNRLEATIELRQSRPDDLLLGTHCTALLPPHG